jgi:hypothetical protein
MPSSTSAKFRSGREAPIFIAMIACQTERNIRNPESVVWPLAG